MVSSNLGVGSFAPYEYPEVVDVELDKFRKLKKSVPFNGGWEERIFYEVRPLTKTTIDWLVNNYGSLNYQNTWWSTHNSIVMRDSIYTHWKLCQ
jgi:hypothetical protein